MRTLRTPGTFDRIEHLDHAARAGLREMAHIGGGLFGQAEFDHFVRRPERAVDQQQVGVVHRFEYVRFERAKARRVERTLARMLVDERQPDVVAALRCFAMRRIGRRLARQRQRFNAYARQRGNGERRAIERNRVAFDAAVMREYRYNRKAGAQVLQDGVGDIKRQRGIAFAQHQQAGHVIDLCVHGDAPPQCRCRARAAPAEVRDGPRFARAGRAMHSRAASPRRSR